MARAALELESSIRALVVAAASTPRRDAVVGAVFLVPALLTGILLGRGSPVGVILFFASALAAGTAAWRLVRRWRGRQGAPRDWVQEVHRTFPDTIARVDRDGRVLGVFSPHPSRIFGEREALLGTDALALVAEGQREEVGRAIAATIATGTPSLLELDGRDGPVETRVVRAAKDEALLICRFVGAERKADREHRLLAKLITEMHDAVLLLDADRRIQVWTGGAERTYGWTAAEVIGRRLEDVLQPELVDVTAEEMAARSTEGKACRFRARDLRKDGTRIPVMVLLVPHFEAPGGPPMVLSVSRDMSAEAAAEADQRLLAALTREMTDAVFVIDGEARIQIWTGGAEAVYGYRAAEVIGRSAVDLLSASQRSVSVEQLRQALLSGKPLQYRSLSRRCDGRQIICACSAVPIRDEGGAYTRALFVARDVTREAEMEKELARSHDQLASALEGSGLGHWQLDCRTGDISYDHHWPEMLGYSEGEIPPLLAPWVALADPSDVPRVKAAVFAHMKGETDNLDCEFRLRDRKGRWRWIHSRGRVVARDGSGQALLLSGTHADVTRRREAEECMRAALEANVRLVAELREALANVKTLSGLLPVCAWCKKIRDDDGYWQRIETYISEHSAATFTHGMCPECRAREFADRDDDA